MNNNWVPHAGECIPEQPSWLITQVFDWTTYWDITLLNKKSGQVGCARVQKPKNISDNDLPTND